MSARVWGGYRAPVAVLISIVAVVCLRGVLSLRGYLYLDDFAFRYWAATSPLDGQYLLRSYGGHVNPVGLGVQWVLQAAFPGSHLALALYSLAMFAVALFLFAAIIWRVTRRWGACVLGVLIAGVSMLGFEVTVWWAAAIYAASYQVFLLLTVYAGIRAVTDKGRVWTIVGVASGVGTVLSFSRGSVGLVLAFGLAAALPLADGRPLGVRSAFRNARVLWLALLVTALLGGSLVLTAADGVTADGFTPWAIPGYAWRLLVLNVLPAMWGGPWRWFELPNPDWPPILANPAPMWWAVWLAALMSAAVLVAILLRRRSLRPLVAVVCGYVLAVLVLAGIARAGVLVGSVAYRYTFDLLWPLTLLVIVSIFPAAGRVWRPGVLVAALTIFLALLSTIVPANDWASNRGKQYMANAVAGFGTIPEGQAVLNQGVPFDLIHPGLMAPYANVQVVVTPQPGAPAFGPYAPESMFGFAPDGSVQIQGISGPVSRPGPDEGCGYRVTDFPRTIPLDGTLIAWDFYARIAYFSGTDTTLNLAVGGKIHTVPLQGGGLRVVYLPVGGPATDVLVSLGTPGAVACVTDIRIGNRVAPGTEDVVPLPVTQLPQ